jgi:membrane carboxypeptidase/penicillin-binding protein
VEDEPLRVRTAKGTWEPENYDREFRGPVTLREAMEQSLNVPFARIGLSLGPARIAATARRLGITSPLNPVPSLALGSSELSLLELVRAYGVFAAGGYLATTQTMVGSARYGEFVSSGPPELAPVVEPAVAYLVTSTLEGVVTRGTGRALTQYGRLEGIAGKTGTSNDWRDAWFIAYSPSLVVGAWVGFDDGRSLHLTGASAALPIVARFLEQASGNEQWESFPRPEGITEAYVVSATNGWLPNCGSQELFLEGTEPDTNACVPFDIPPWERLRDWGGELKRRAAQVLEQLTAELEQRTHR